MPAGPPITVAVVSWNTRDLLDRCLRSLRPDAERGLVEVWVVDNASSDGSAERARAEFRWVRLVASEENLGFGRAVNVVAARTASPWLVIANADVAVRPGALDRLLAAAECDPGAGAVAPRLVLPDGTTQHSVFGFPSLPYMLALNAGLFHLSRDLADRMAYPGRWDHERARRVPWAVGAFLLVRRAAWDAIGGFDERQWLYAEDLDLAWRLRRAGWATRFEPGAVVDHESSAATGQVFSAEGAIAERWQRSTYGWMVRRRGLARTWAVAAANALGAGARWLVMAPAALLVPDPWRQRHRLLGRWAALHLRALRGRRALERWR